VLAYDVRVDDANPFGCDSTEGEFRLTGCADLANDHDIEGQMECAGDLPGHRYAPPSKTKHDNVGLVSEVAE